MIEETMNGTAQPGIKAPTPTVQEHDSSNLRMSQLAYNVFNTADGKELLERLKDKHIYTLPWQPGAPEGYGQFRAGQSDIILFFRHALKMGAEGKLADKKGNDNT